jgi:hypothetical protein
MFAMKEITHNNVPEALTEIRKDVSEILKLHRQFYNTQKLPELPDILDINQAAELLGYKVSSIYSMCNRSILPYSQERGYMKKVVQKHVNILILGLHRGGFSKRY